MCNRAAQKPTRQSATHLLYQTWVSEISWETVCAQLGPVASACACSWLFCVFSLRALSFPPLPRFFALPLPCPPVHSLSPRFPAAFPFPILLPLFRSRPRPSTPSQPFSSFSLVSSPCSFLPRPAPPFPSRFLAFPRFPASSPRSLPSPPPPWKNAEQKSTAVV